MKRGGNQMKALYDKLEYLVNEGDEYLRGYPDVFILGRKITE